MQRKVKDTAVAYKTQRRPCTYDDYLTLPDDGRRYEIIEGELFMSPAPTTKHQFVKRSIQHYLHTFVITHNLGEVLDAPTDVVFSDTNIVQPDILFIAKANLHKITEANIRGAPDLIVEILSPATADTDRGAKKLLYERYGVKEYWLVDPDPETVEIYTLQAGRYELAQRAEKTGTVHSVLLPSFSMEVAEIFASPLRG